MNWKVLLLSLFSFALFTACLEEDSGLTEMIAMEPYTINVAAQEGTGLPNAVIIERVVFTDDKGDEIWNQGMHVQMAFNPCSSGWCKAEVDDCGVNSRVKYNYAETGSSASINFADFSTSFTVGGWAVEGAPFRFERDKAKILLTCENCPGNISSGASFTKREIALKVIR